LNWVVQGPDQILDEGREKDIPDGLRKEGEGEGRERERERERREKRDGEGEGERKERG
jgi:hypothetical protein